MENIAYNVRDLFSYTIIFMDISLNKTSDCRAELRAVVPAGDVQAKKKSILAAFSRNARMAGFRPGKVPASVVAKHYAKEITEQLKSELTSDVQRQLFEENPKLKVLGFADMEVKDGEDGSCELTSVLTVVPEFELPAYEGIEVTVPSTEVSDDEVQEAIQRFAEASASYDPVERAATKEDIAVIDFKTSVDGKPVAEHTGRALGWIEGREDYRFSLGEDEYIPGWADGVVGMSVGESKDIVCKLPEDFIVSELKGCDVCFATTVKQVLEKHVPEVTAELFERVLPGKSLDEVREEVRKNLQTNKERSNEEAKADQITEKLADQLSFALPESLVDSEIEGTIQRKVYAAIQAGNYEVSKDMDALREEARRETERNLRVYFALQEIAERESVVATDEEVFREITRMAQQSREKNLKTYVRKLQQEGRIPGIRLSIVTSKVMELLARRAKEVPAEKAE